MVGQLNPGVRVLGFNHHGKKGSKVVVMMDLHQNLFPSTASFGASSVSIANIMSFNVDVGVVINDYHCHLRGEGGGVFIKKFHNSHVGCACNNCNGSTINIYHNRKLQPEVMF